MEAAGGGNDTVQTGQSYTLLNEFEYLTLTGTLNISGTGNAANNVLNGNSGNNLLNGGLGADSMFGGLGNDTYIVDNALDRATETNAAGGTDTVISSVSFTLAAHVENLTLTGSANVDAIGNSLANSLTGNAGNNILAGGLGGDSLAGGSGNDTYLYRTTADSTAANQDAVSGFSAGDRIDLAQIDADASSAATNEAFTFIGNNAFSNTAGELRAVNNGSGNWTILADTNGDGNADLAIALTTANPTYIITTTDFAV